MMLKFLIDENLRGGFWQLVQRHNSRALDPIDALRVGDPVDLPLGSDDPAILEWCERHGYILVTHDKNTMPKHLSARLKCGDHVPGIFMLRSDRQLGSILEIMVLAAYATKPDEWRDWINYVP